jgi:hypothetical protein
MFPFRYSSIFKSRWMALLWAAGIIWWAVDIAGTSPASDQNNADQAAQTDAVGQPVDPKQVKQMEDTLHHLGG